MSTAQKNRVINYTTSLTQDGQKKNVSISIDMKGKSFTRNGIKFDTDSHSGRKSFTDQDYAADIMRVVRNLKLDPEEKLTVDTYNQYGLFSPIAIKKRFGSFDDFVSAVRKAGYSAQVSNAAILKDIRRVEKLCGASNMNTQMYKVFGRVSLSTVKSRFGSFTEGVKKARAGSFDYTIH